MELRAFPDFLAAKPKPNHFLDNAHTVSEELSKTVCPHFLITISTDHMVTHWPCVSCAGKLDVPNVTSVSKNAETRNATEKEIICQVKLS